MKKYISIALAVLLGFSAAQAQNAPIKGKCGEDVEWLFNFNTLTITAGKKNGVKKTMYDYDMRDNISPWRKKKLNIEKVIIGEGITSIGSCAFAGCENLNEVTFNGKQVKTIGWGAFMNCSNLGSISLPNMLNSIEDVAFANCRKLSRITIPKCKVGDKAFACCNNLNYIDCAAIDLGQMVFAKEESVDGKIQHVLYSGSIGSIPSYIDSTTCEQYGLDKEAVIKFTGTGKGRGPIPIPMERSLVDTNIPKSDKIHNNIYALIIGNQEYRSGDSEVIYAIRDARVFKKYCENTIGIPSSNIFEIENATKHMIMEEALGDWLGSIEDREQKRLIIYYAGHGMLGIKDNTDNNEENNKKSYLLPTDVRGTNPKGGIALDEFYAKVGRLEFEQTTIFLDACFSGANRSGGSVTKGLRAPVRPVPPTPIDTGNLIVFSACQGNETAQSYHEHEHGLFTYYLLKELQDNYMKDDFNLGSLAEHVIKGVSTTAKNLKIRKDQTPTVNASSSLKEEWQYRGF